MNEQEINALLTERNNLHNENIAYLQKLTARDAIIYNLRDDISQLSHKLACRDTTIATMDNEVFDVKTKLERLGNCQERPAYVEAPVVNSVDVRNQLHTKIADLVKENDKLALENKNLESALKHAQDVHADRIVDVLESNKARDTYIKAYNTLFARNSQILEDFYKLKNDFSDLANAAERDAKTYALEAVKAKYHIRSTDLPSSVAELRSVTKNETKCMLESNKAKAFLTVIERLEAIGNKHSEAAELLRSINKS